MPEGLHGDEALAPLLDQTPPDDPRELGDYMWDIYERSGDMMHLDASIKATRGAIALKPNPVDAGLLFSLGARSSTRFDLTNNPDDLGEAISGFQRATELASDTAPDTPMLYNLLGYYFITRYRRFNDLSEATRRDDLNRAINSFKRASELSPDSSPAVKASRLQNLILALVERFEIAGDGQDNDLAIDAAYRAVELLPKGSLEKAQCLNLLGNSLFARFQLSGRLPDVEASVSSHLRALVLIPDGHRDKPMILHNVGNSTHIRFEHMGRPEDLETSISMHRLAVDLTPNDDNQNKSDRLNSLSCSLLSRYQISGYRSDIEEAISTCRSAIELTAHGHRRKASRYNNLGISLLTQYRSNGELHVLEEAISAHRIAVDLTAEESADMPSLLSNLGLSLSERFTHSGGLEDAENAIAAHLRAIDLVQDGSADKASCFANLADAFRVRYERLRDVEDIENSISACLRAIELAPEGHFYLPSYHNNLANALRLRFKRVGDLGDLGDLDNAISAIRLAIEMTPGGHHEQPLRLSNLGASLMSRYERNLVSEDLDDAIAAYREAIQATPDAHPSRSGILFNLAQSLCTRFEHDQKQESDLDESISALRDGLELLHEDTTDRPSLLRALGTVLHHQFDRHKFESTFDAAVRSFVGASRSALGSPSTRLHSAVLCVAMHTAHPDFGSTDSLLSAYECILDVLPEIAWLGYGVSRRYDEITKLGQHVNANAAVCAAIGAGALSRAVEWLEAGRSLVWAQVLSLRTPLDALEERHPLLARSIRAIQPQLQSSGHFSVVPEPSGAHSVESGFSGIVPNAAVDHHRRLAIQYQHILAKVRGCPGFENFLRPKTLSDLVSSHNRLEDHVVFVNVAPARCDALVLTGEGVPRLVVLSELTYDIVKTMSRLWKGCLRRGGVRLQRGDDDRGMIEHNGDEEPRDWMRVLGTLWRFIVRPVLLELDMLKPVSGDQMPHVTWCPTGPLTQLPLHAAGLYGVHGGPRVYDFVISSYTPSLSALQRCRSSVNDVTTASNVLIVAQPKTPRAGLAPLRFVTTECNHIRAVLPPELQHVFLEHDKATLESTLRVIGRCPWVHFACHGSQKLGEPTKSAFELYDGPLTLATLMSTVSDDAELAFLSACQTAKGDESIPEESAHLAAGMLAVGFKGVVATMWTIRDNDAPVVVKAYYEKLIDLRMAGTVKKGRTGAARALHEAVAHLREEVGIDKFERWVPFVHFGV
ncbi:unnamed protein product [Peniophora sp. CBMAI 1063]|nr:unnamed protein product [Peniophora sp. CBMAI 1063]